MATDLRNTSNSLIGVIGAGTFGLAVSGIIAESQDVLLYTRRKEVLEEVHRTGSYRGRSFKRIRITNDAEELAKSCTTIFPVVSAAGFRSTMQKFAPYLYPDHILIHCTKGLDIVGGPTSVLAPIEKLKVGKVLTMSQVIQEETTVLRIGCMAGPNLAAEIFNKEPAATVVASRFNEVIEEGKRLLKTDWFRVYHSHDLIGIELAGVLKNIMAIMSGILYGLNYGHNARALLVARGLAEIVEIGELLGAKPSAFLGVAGVGDLVATCSSPKSRNFTFGRRIASGEKPSTILANMEEVVEGVNTTRTIYALAKQYNMDLPIVRVLYRVIFHDMPLPQAQKLLMEYPFLADVTFM